MLTPNLTFDSFVFRSLANLIVFRSLANFILASGAAGNGIQIQIIETQEQIWN